MMVKVLLYACRIGTPPSREIEKKTHEDVAFRFLAAGHHPGHDTISSFRSTRLHAMKHLFLQVLALCRQAGLVRAGHVSLEAQGHELCQDGGPGEAVRGEDRKSHRL